MATREILVPQNTLAVPYGSGDAPALGNYPLTLLDVKVSPEKLLTLLVDGLNTEMSLSSYFGTVPPDIPSDNVYTMEMTTDEFYRCFKREFVLDSNGAPVRDTNNGGPKYDASGNYLDEYDNRVLDKHGEPIIDTVPVLDASGNHALDANHNPIYISTPRITDDKVTWRFEKFLTSDSTHLFPSNNYYGGEDTRSLMTMFLNNGRNILENYLLYIVGKIVDPAIINAYKLFMDPASTKIKVTKDAYDAALAASNADPTNQGLITAKNIAEQHYNTAYSENKHSLSSLHYVWQEMIDLSNYVVDKYNQHKGISDAIVKTVLLFNDGKFTSAMPTIVGSNIQWKLVIDPPDTQSTKWNGDGSKTRNDLEAIIPPYVVNLRINIVEYHTLFRNVLDKTLVIPTPTANYQYSPPPNGNISTIEPDDTQYVPYVESSTTVGGFRVGR